MEGPIPPEQGPMPLPEGVNIELDEDVVFLFYNSLSQDQRENLQDTIRGVATSTQVNWTDVIIVGEITEAFHPFLEEDEQRRYVCDEREIPPARAWGRSMKADRGLENLLQAEINHQFVLLPPGQPSEIERDGTNEWLAFKENTLVDTDDLDPKEGFPVRLDQLIELG